MGDKGYFLHELGCCETERVGTGTRIWAFSHVLPGARIGESCNICDHVFIENDVVVGDRVTVKSGVQLWDGTTLEDDVFIGPNATFTNDQFPRSQQYLDKYPRTVVCHGASVGANATILPGLTIGRHAMVGAGAVVTRSIPPPMRLSLGARRESRVMLALGIPISILPWVDQANPRSQVWKPPASIG